jgi:hypothetical protein
MAIDIRDATSHALQLGPELAAALPMATLGLIGDGRSEGAAPDLGDPITVLGTLRQ